MTREVASIEEDFIAMCPIKSVAIEALVTCMGPIYEHAKHRYHCIIVQYFREYINKKIIVMER